MVSKERCIKKVGLLASIERRILRIVDLLPLTGDFFRADLWTNFNLTMVKRRVFDEAFKEMAVELSYVKGSIQEAARELGVDPGRISKWRQRHKKTDQTLPANAPFTDEQQQIRRLQRELKEAQMERDILKKAVSIFSRGDGRYSDL